MKLPLMFRDWRERERENGAKGRGDSKNVLNKFPLSCVCYSRVENGRASGAGGQGQLGAAATGRAEGAR